MDVCEIIDKELLNTEDIYKEWFDKYDQLHYSQPYNHTFIRIHAEIRIIN